MGDTTNCKVIASKLEPSYLPTASDRLTVPSEDKADGAPIGHLFKEGRGFSTVMFWLAFFMCLFMVYALSSWLTKLMAGAGYSLGSALTFVLVLNFGAVIGAVGGGWLADKFHIKVVLAAMYALAAGSITLLGQPMPTAALFFVVGLAGACDDRDSDRRQRLHRPVLSDGDPRLDRPRPRRSASAAPAQSWRPSSSASSSA